MRLIASQALVVLETFRVPYDVAHAEVPGAVGRITCERGAELIWTRPGPAEKRAFFQLGDISLYGAVSGEDDVQSALDAAGRDWQASDRILDAEGNTLGSVWRAPDRSTLLPFDPNEVVLALLREEYVLGGFATSLTRKLYYGLRPALPRSLQMAMRRRFARVQERAAFPRWPTEPALHDFFGYLLCLVEDVLGAPLPWIAPWPEPYRWSVVLTHDVEREKGYEHVREVVALERRVGVRSAWYFVPEREYRVESNLIQALERDGFEICVHGLRHDGSDLSPGTFEERLPAMLSYAQQWGAVGFRAPATQRDWDRIAALGFAHDSSYSDVARYEPQSGGSCTWLPFFVGETLELPITLPMDHTLFDLLQHRSAGVWFEKASFLRERGGMAVLLTHPDYLVDPSRLDEYHRFVLSVVEDSEAWIALPRDVAAWWRRRAASSVELDGGEWRVKGPATREAQLVLGALRGA